jgi:hypothetical protein
MCKVLKCINYEKGTDYCKECQYYVDKASMVIRQQEKEKAECAE